ncbi:MAG: hypothetical protein Q8K46_04180, partial [Deltaproteobacteria bacterium]|nr:hypothetical protein [Deltaproteobacteria bacterium]
MVFFFFFRTPIRYSINHNLTQNCRCQREHQSGRERILEKIRDAVRTGNYDMTFHAIEEMAEDELGIL